MEDACVVKTMADCMNAKCQEDIPLHAALTDPETGQMKKINPATADPHVTQGWVWQMMRGEDSPLYAAFQPGAKGGKLEPSERTVTFEELLLRRKDNLQSFPIIVHMHLKKQQRHVLKVWEIYVH